MNKQRALRLGFAPYTPDLFDGDTQTEGYWTRVLQRPRCAQYWDPTNPQQLRMRLLDAEGRPTGELLDTVTPSIRRTLQGAHNRAAGTHVPAQPQPATSRPRARTTPALGRAAHCSP